jgi:hypothetical protein
LVAGLLLSSRPVVVVVVVVVVATSYNMHNIVAENDIYIIIVLVGVANKQRATRPGLTYVWHAGWLYYYHY